ncbi:hypothetical protein SMMN14_07779 [Sphaerulina musiva]
MAPRDGPRTLVPITITSTNVDQEWKIWWPLNISLQAIINTIEDLTHHHAPDHRLDWNGRDLFSDLAKPARDISLWHIGIQRPTTLTLHTRPTNLLHSDGKIYDILVSFSQDARKFAYRIPSSAFLVKELVKPGGLIERSWDNENGKGNGTMLRGGGNGGGGLRLTFGEKEIWNSRWERGVQVRALGRRAIDDQTERCESKD